MIFRPALYRGKPYQKDGSLGPWVYGYFIKDGPFSFILDENNVRQKHYVNEATVCQYVGEKDYWGSYIFECDIVSVSQGDGKVEVGEVRFQKNEQGIWMIGMITSGKFVPLQFDDPERPIIVVGDIFEGQYAQ